MPKIFGASVSAFESVILSNAVFNGRRFVFVDIMKKSCKYCGGIHDRNYVCEKKPQIIRKKYYHKRNSEEDIFRSSYDWKKKREYIMKRDKYLCQACLNNFSGTVRRLTSDGLSVHHIIPLKKDFTLRLSDNNLITLCSLHHELAEKGKIPVEALVGIISPLPCNNKKMWSETT